MNDADKLLLAAVILAVGLSYAALEIGGLTAEFVTINGRVGGALDRFNL